MTEIYDSNRQLKYANDDLRAIRSMILTTGDHTEYDNAYDTLKVIDKALESIIVDIQRAVNDIDTALSKLKTETEKYLSDSAFKTGERFVIDSSGRLYVPAQSGFTEDATISDTMQKLAKIVPAAVLGDQSDFDKEYGIYNIDLNLEIPEEEYDAEAADYLMKVREMIQTGPILNARVYLVTGAQDSVSMFTYWEDSEIKTEENYPVTEAYHSMEMSKMFRDNPGIMFSYIDIEKLKARIESLLER